MSYNNIFDSHAHYDDVAFADDLDDVIKKIQESGVTNVINIGCSIQTSKNSIELANKYPFFYCSVGIHPGDCENLPDNYIDILRDLAKNEKVVAIGEIGLDYHYTDGASPAQQQKVFEEQLILAKELDLPVIIHSREATQDTMELLKKYKPKGVVHCFSGSAQTAKEIVKLGMYLGFTGVLTFNNAKKAKEAVLEIPVDRLLLETDCPYMAPTPFRGKRCDSSLIEYTATAMALLKGVSTQEMIDIANKNTCELFNIK